MHLETLDLSPGTTYEVGARREMSPGITLKKSFTMATDEEGRICACSESLPNFSPREAAEIWDILVLKDRSTGVTTDLRLHTAAIAGDVGLAREALRGGADIRLRLRQGATALHLASANGYFEIAELLVQSGAEIDVADDIDWTPMFLAAKGNHLEIAVLLHSHGASNKGVLQGQEIEIDMADALQGELFGGAEAGDLERVKRAVDAGADINATTPHGWSVLLCAADSDAQLTSYLLDRGVDPNLPSGKGYTPLMRAAGKGRLGVVQLLLGAGVDSGARDSDGKTASQLAAEMGEQACATLCGRFNQ